MARNMGQLSNLKDWQKWIIPRHTCRQNYILEDDEVLPQPPPGSARILCPKKGCRLPLFVRELAPWVETPRIHPNKNPLRFLSNIASIKEGREPWFNKRCDNCGRWGHLTSMCDQIGVQIKCSFCGLFAHDITECDKFQQFKRTTKIKPYTLGKLDENGKVVQPHNQPVELAPNRDRIDEAADNSSTPKENRATSKSSTPVPYKDEIAATIKEQMARYFEKYKPSNSESKSPEVAEKPIVREQTPSPPKRQAFSRSSSQYSLTNSMESLRSSSPKKAQEAKGDKQNALMADLVNTMSTMNKMLTKLVADKSHTTVINVRDAPETPHEQMHTSTEETDETEIFPESAAEQRRSIRNCGADRPIFKPRR